MPSSDLTSEIKTLLVAELNLNRDPASLHDDAPLFGDGGMGLDSLDALQIAMLVEERFGVRVPDGDEARPIFRSVSSLAEFIRDHGGGATNGKAGSANPAATPEKP